MKLASGHEVVTPPEEVQKAQREDFEGYAGGVIKLIPGEWFLTKQFIKYADRLYNFKFKPTDVVVLTFPKCGTTWMQEMIWTMRNNPNLDNPMDAMPVNAKVPFMELDFIMECPTLTPPGPESDLMKGFFKMCPGKDPKDGVMIQMSEAASDPRTLKSHLPFTLLPPNMLDTCKVVYYLRNPKDAVVSFHHHSRIMRSHQYTGTFDKFVDYFLANELLYSPYWSHVKEGWERRNHPNLHFCYYEDFKADPKKRIQELDHFLGTKLTEEQVDNVVTHTSFEAMKKRDNLMGGKADQEKVMVADLVAKEGGFFRKGESGSYKAKLTAEQEAKIDEWTKKNTQNMEGEFKYTIK